MAFPRTWKPECSLSIHARRRRCICRHERWAISKRRWRRPLGAIGLPGARSRGVGAGVSPDTARDHVRRARPCRCLSQRRRWQHLAEASGCGGHRTLSNGVSYACPGHRCRPRLSGLRLRRTRGQRRDSQSRRRRDLDRPFRAAHKALRTAQPAQQAEQQHGCVGDARLTRHNHQSKRNLAAPCLACAWDSSRPRTTVQHGTTCRSDGIRSSPIAAT